MDATGGARFRRVRCPAGASRGLVRNRLLDLLSPVANSPLGLVVAGPGHGKSTLLAHFVETFPGDVIWYRATPRSSGADLLACFASGLGGRPVSACDPSGLLDAVLTAGERSTHPALLVIDDLHRMEATAVESVLEGLVLNMPPQLHLLVASRRMPSINLSKLELADTVVVDTSQLRFRWHEAERLFSDVYGEPLHAEEVLPLTWMTEGWAAGLHLFHLAVTGFPVSPEPRVPGAGASAFAASYLDREMLAQLPEEHRRFLELVCVLDVMTAERCDALLGTSGSRRLLEELAFDYGVLRVNAADHTFYPEELLRDLLVTRLVDELGPARSRAWFAKAGHILTEDRAFGAALVTAIRAGDRETARALLARHDGRLRDRRSAYWAQLMLPPSEPSSPPEPGRPGVATAAGRVGGVADAAGDGGNLPCSWRSAQASAESNMRLLRDPASGQDGVHGRAHAHQVRTQALWVRGWLAFAAAERSRPVGAIPAPRLPAEATTEPTARGARPEEPQPSPRHPSQLRPEPHPGGRAALPPESPRKPATRTRGATEPRLQPVPAEALGLRCFGIFEVRMGGRALDLSAVRPRAQALLRLLSLHAGRPVHRERIIEALWPNRPPDAATGNLHVAVSALRHLLEPGVPRAGFRLLVRRGETYQIVLPPGSEVDIITFGQAAREGHRAHAAGRMQEAAATLYLALAAYTGDLLPEDGPADWVVEERDHYRRQVTDVASLLAEIELGLGNPGAAAEVAGRCLSIDPFRDSAWRLLIAAYERAGSAAAAERARKAYAEMLHSLGVEPSDTRSAG